MDPDNSSGHHGDCDVYRSRSTTRCHATAFRPNHALSPDDGTASTATPARRATASIMLTGFNQLGVADLPPGVQITKVLAKVVHKDDPNTSGVVLGGKDAQGIAFANQTVTPCT